MHALGGDVAAAKTVLKDALAGVNDDGATAAYHDFIIAYNSGNIDAVVASVPTLNNGAEFDFERIIVTGAFDEEYEHIGTHDVDDQLLFWSAVLSRHKNHANARRRLTALFGELDQAAWMTTAPSVADLKALGTHRALRRAVAVALSVLHDDDAMLQEAQRLCRPTSSPTLFVLQLRAARTPPSATP